MIGFDDLADDGNAGRDNYADIRRAAHVVNGGDALFDCPSCKGSGKFISYSGRVVGDCFKCKGKGKITKGQNAAHKGKLTRQENDRKFFDAHRDEIRYMNAKADGGFRLMANLRAKFEDNRRLGDADIATIRKFMAQDAERDAARTAERAKKKEESAVSIDLSGIHALFQTASDNKVKRPIFRTEDFDLSKAPANGRNAGAIYVTARHGNTEYGDGAYLGKIVNGKYYATEWAPKDAAEKLIAVAIDPLKESIKYARRTGRCGCCGRGLVDPVSILAGIGPICAENYGLNWRRDLGAAEYEHMKAEESK